MTDHQELDLTKVSRIEIIDHTPTGTGRDYVKWEDQLDVKLSLQDDGRTLKVFISEPEEG